MKLNSKVCIYTAIFGGYDELKKQPQQTIDCDFVCFSDTNPENTQGWTIQKRQQNSLPHPRLKAKYYKLMSHELFVLPVYRFFPLLRSVKQKYPVTIWIDGSVKIRSPRFAEEMVNSLGTYGLAMFVHPDRNCIYDEVDLCSDFEKYRQYPLKEQVAHYQQQGYPKQNGLMAAGIIVRDMNNPMVATINNAWWHENRRWTYQDQLSLPYILWKHNYGYDPIHLNLWNNHLFELAPHHSNL